MNYLEVRGVVHEVICEHFESHSDDVRSLKLDLMCGGHVFTVRDLPWKHEGIVTCFWCIARESRYRIHELDIKMLVSM